MKRNQSSVCIRDHLDQRFAAAKATRAVDVELEEVLDLTIDDRMIREGVIALILDRVENLSAAAAVSVFQCVLADLLSRAGAEHGNLVRVAARLREGEAFKRHVLGWDGFRQCRAERTPVVRVFHAVIVSVGVGRYR